MIPAFKKKISISCPVCKKRGIVEIPLSIIKENKPLTTISIPKGELCDHHFQIFIDRNYAIRGFQKVDFELKELNTLDTQNSKNNKKDENCHQITQISQDRKNMSLKEIYEEFWEFIGDDNETFQHFIIEDKRREHNSNQYQIHSI
jgi:hypothetical protein